MAEEYIEERGGNYYVAGTRISLDSIIHAVRRGESPETIRQNFELLQLEEVDGAIAYYLANQRDLDAYLRRQDEKWIEGKRQAQPVPADLRDRLMRARRIACDSPIVKVRFLADADLNKAIVSGVLLRAFSGFPDCPGGWITPHERSQGPGAGRRSSADSCFTRCRNDAVSLPHIQECWIPELRCLPHPTGLHVGTAIDELLLVWYASKASEWENRLQWLPL